MAPEANVFIAFGPLLDYIAAVERQISNLKRVEMV
jgi:hypothetical protein